MPNNVNVRVGTSGVGKASSDLDHLRDKFDRLQKQGAKGFAIGAGAAITAKGLSILDSAVSGALETIGAWGDAASNLEQSAGAIESVFGSAADQIASFGETADTNFGLSKRAVNELAATTGAQLKSFGFSVDEAATETIKLQKRAADLAATFGGPTEDAVRAISALMRGERDPIERYGVSLKDVDIKARVMARGLNTSTVEATKHSEAIAALELFYEQTADAAGQFARESNEAAGQNAKLTAELENMSAEIGQDVLPLQISLMELQRDLIPVLKDVAGAVVTVNEGFEGWGDLVGAVFDPVHDALNDDTMAVGRLGGRMVETDEAADDMAGGLETVTSRSHDARKAAEDLEGALEDLTEATYDAVDAFGDQVYSADELKGKLSEAEEAVREAKDEVLRLAAIKNPTKDQQEDLIRARARLAEARHEAFDTRVELAKLDGTGLDALYKELSGVQYMTGRVGDAAREALSYFQKLAYASGKVTGFKGDPGYAPRADGGPVTANTPYLVGEEGPEVFVPGASGQIIPNGGTGSSGGWSGGGMTFAPTVVIQGIATPATVAAIVNDLGPAFGDYLRRSGWSPS